MADLPQHLTSPLSASVLTAALQEQLDRDAQLIFWKDKAIKDPKVDVRRAAQEKYWKEHFLAVVCRHLCCGCVRNFKITRSATNL